MYALHSLVFQLMKLANTSWPSFGKKSFTWTVMPQSFTESPCYFSQILEADLGDINFTQGYIHNPAFVVICG